MATRRKKLAPGEIEMEPVDSSAVNAVGYNGSTKTLVIDWKKGGKYKYYPISSEVHEALMTSSSIGETANYIKRSVTGVKI